VSFTSSIRRRAAPFLLAALAFPAAAYARDPLGTAGPFRSVGYVQCEGNWEQGACDPAPVDPGLLPAQQSGAHVDRALKLIALARLPQARESLDAAVKADPSNVSALKLRARVVMSAGADAGADVNAGLLLDPNDSDLLAMRAWLLHDHSKSRAGLLAVNKSIQINSRNADALWIRARILLANHWFEDAEADLTKALAIEPDYFQALHLRAAVRMQLDRPAEALADANRALEQRPTAISAFQLRSMAHAALGDFQGLVADLTAVLGEPGQPANADPSMAMFTGMYVQRAIALVRLGRHGDAMQDIDTVARLGGQQAILRMQVYLRSNGFPDVPVDGKRSGLFDDAMKSCFVDQACGRGIAERI
jgi:tetratricopeptide (TPR) repeat protein